MCTPPSISGCSAHATHLNARTEKEPLSSGSANAAASLVPPMLSTVPSSKVTPVEQKTLLFTSKGRKVLVAKSYSSA